MALAQNVTIHAMSAGEKFFVDLLPTSWSGMPPGLPQDVVDELARRAREAERLLERQRAACRTKKAAPIRVHVASQPTFTRYVFAVPSETGVSADRAKDRLVLKFDSPLTFDLGDVQAALPKTVQEISSELDQDSSLVRFILAANADTRTFRDESGYVVDVVNPRRRECRRRRRCRRTANRAGSECGEARRGRRGRCGAEPRRRCGENFGRGGGARRSAGARAAAAGARRRPYTAARCRRRRRRRAAGAGSAMRRRRRKRPRAAAVGSAGRAPEHRAAVHGALATVVGLAEPPYTARRRPRRPQSLSKPPRRPRVPQPQPQPRAAAAPPKPPPRAGKAAQPRRSAAVAAPQAAPAPPNKSDAMPRRRRAAAPSEADSAGKIAAELSEQGADLKLTFAFKTPVGMAVFQRADTLWLVFDAKADDRFERARRRAEPHHSQLRVLPFRRRRRGAAQARPSAAVQRRRRRRRYGRSISATPSSIRPARSTSPAI